MKRILILVYIVIASATYTIAQDTLRMDEAINMALAQNYGIQVAQNQVLTSENSATKGNAGLLPTLDVVGGLNYSNNGSAATFADGRVVEQPMVVTDNNNLSIQAGYTLFDGFAGTYSYRILKTNALISEEQARTTVDQTLAQVMNAYFQVSRLANNYTILQQATTVSSNRMTRIKTQREYGSGTRLGILNARVDMNTDSVNLVTARLSLENAKRDLMQLLAGEIDAEFEVIQNVTLLPGMDIEQLVNEAIENNPAIVIASYNRKVSELNLRTAKAAQMPRIDLNASYGFRNSNNGPLSFVSNTSSIGLGVGATLNFNLFDGFQKKISIQNAELETFNTELRFKEARTQLQHDLGNTVANYRNSLEILRLEERSLEAAQLNFEQTQESFKLGQSTGLQFREAQLNLIRSQNRLNELRFDVKLFETELLRLSGTLVEM